jgi:hypothetical protein
MEAAAMEAGRSYEGHVDGRFEDGGGRTRVGKRALVGLYAVRVDWEDAEDGAPGECIDPDEILFAFTRGAVAVGIGGPRKPAILAKWARGLPPERFPKEKVFVRTRSGVFRTYLRTLEEFKRVMSSDRFEPVSKSVIANLCEVQEVNLMHQRERTLSYGVEVSEISWHLESVVVGRTQLGPVRKRYGMPRRVQGHS